jgi:hypothetical protein
MQKGQTIEEKHAKRWDGDAQQPCCFFSLILPNLTSKFFLLFCLITKRKFMDSNLFHSIMGVIFI